MEAIKNTIGVALCAAISLVTLGCHGAKSAPQPPPPPINASLRPLNLTDPQERLAAEKPLEFLRQCRDHCAATVKDYTCRFCMSERVDDTRPEMGPQQEIDIRFREQPYSVDMRWAKNAMQASRVNFVKGRWRRGERELALIVPAGLLNILAPAGVRLDIHSPDVRGAHARGIDDFGFKKTLESIITRCEKAEGRPGFDLRAVGVGTFDGRECIVVERRLPYTGPGGEFPDRLFVMYIDKEWRVPLACYAHADDQATAPIGTYEARDVRLNVGLTDGDF